MCETRSFHPSRQRAGRREPITDLTSWTTTSSRCSGRALLRPLNIQLLDWLCRLDHPQGLVWLLGEHMWGPLHFTVYHSVLNLLLFL